MDQIKIYNYDSYKEFVTDLVKTFPSNGRGVYLKLANHLRTHTTLISQIFRGERELTMEQGHGLCDFFKLDTKEKRYFLTMLSYAKAGSFELRNYYKSEMQSIKEDAERLKNRLNVDKKLSDQEMARFYSNPIYSTIRLLTSIEGKQDVDSISKKLNIAKETVEEIVSFLLETGLCLEENGLILMGPSKTHIPENSPYVINHHRNWRIKGLESQAKKAPTDLFYSGPMTLSEDDAKKVKEIISTSLQDIYQVLGPSKSEKLYCLNFDWFEVT